MKVLKLTKRKVLSMSLIAATFGLVLSLLTLNVVQLNFQKIKYGEARKICLGKLGVEISDNWKILILVSKDSTTPMLFGLIPVPRNLSALNKSSASLILTDLKSEKNVAIFPDIELGNVSEKLENCKKNPYCSVGDVFVGDKNFTSLIVKSGEEHWLTIIDYKISIVSALPRIDGIFLKMCTVK